MARTQGNDIQVWGVTREVHGEDVVRMVKQVIRPGIMEKNWRRWKGKKPTKREMMKTIPEEEEIEEEKSGVREWTEEDDDEMGNMADPYYEL